jgi:hypothetical protein
MIRYLFDGLFNPAFGFDLSAFEVGLPATEFVCKTPLEF